MKDIVAQNSVPPGEQRGVLLEQEQTTDLREYWFVVYRHRRAALAFFLFMVFLTAMSIPWGDPLYTAQTTLYMPNQTRNMFGSPEALTPSAGYQQTQVTLLKSRSLIAEVIKDLKLADNPHFTNVPESPLSWGIKQLRQAVKSVLTWVAESSVVKRIQEYLGMTPEEAPRTAVQFELGVHPVKISRYLEALSVTLAPESSLVDLKFSTSSPSLSKSVVNRHAAAFISRNLATRFELTAETRQFLETKLVELKANVENSETALNRFQKDHEIVSLDKGGSLLLDRLKRLNTDLTAAQFRRIELESLHKVVQKGDNRLLSQVIENPTIQALRKQITGLETQLAHLSTKFKPTYRGVIALQQEIDEAKNRADQEINRIVHSIETDYRAALAKEQALAIEAQRARKVALDLQENAVEYAVLEREVESNRALYEAVFKKTKEAALTGEEPIPNLRIVDRAEIPVFPDSDKETRKLILGIGAGLMGAIGLAFLLHILDNSFRTPEDVARFFHLPTLGTVPDLAKLANGHAHELGYGKNITLPPGQSYGQFENKKQLMISHHPLSLVGEMYRSICTAILFSQADRPPQTILITSSGPHEGKTVTAVNVAMMLAQSGGPVLLIDADLHGGRCHSLLGLTNGSGLTTILTGNGEANSLIKKTSVNNLSFLSRGTLPPNPADLLGSEKMRQSLDALAAQFRFIVIDSAPLLPVSDTVLLSTKVDGVILVARGEEVSRHLVRRARERLDYVGAKILGVVLNGIDIWSPEYGEYRNVYQSHYTHYANGNGEQFSNGDPTSIEAGSLTLTPGFVDRMGARLAEFVGPMAVIVLRDAIAALGESPDTFPRSRLKELIETVTQEISDNKMKDSFQEQLAEDIRNQQST